MVFQCSIKHTCDKMKFPKCFVNQNCFGKLKYAFYSELNNVSNTKPESTAAHYLTTNNKKVHSYTISLYNVAYTKDLVV